MSCQQATVASVKICQVCGCQECPDGNQWLINDHSVSDSAGMKVISSRQTPQASTNGRHSRNTGPDGTRAIEALMKTRMPIGGDTSASSRLNTMMMPRWIGLTPIDAISGVSSGTMMSIVGMTSRKQPASNVTTFTISSICHFTWMKVVTQARICCGICSASSTQA